MSGLAMFWMAILGLSTLLFLVVSVFIAINGWKDLKDLLRTHERP